MTRLVFLDKEFFTSLQFIIKAYLRERMMSWMVRNNFDCMVTEVFEEPNIEPFPYLTIKVWLNGKSKETI